jgi:KDO2-lipid IV(A) lauroyltransferase
VERTGDLEADVTTLTARLAAALEAEIRKAPEQYFWFHRRWKTKPPAEQSASETGTFEAVSAPADPHPDDA